MTEYYSFTVKKSHLRLDQYLAGKLPTYSRSKIQHYIKNGQVSIDGNPAKSSLLLRGSEFIECHFTSDIKNESINAESMNLDIIYEDDALAVINKPAGLVVHPGSGNYSGTLLNGLLYHFKQLSHSNSDRPGIVHRLDKDTSGVIIIAKNDMAHNALSQQFNLRNVKKEYLALTWGKLDEKGIINGNIGRHPRNRQLFTVLNFGGRDSITQYELDKYSPPFSFVKLYPKTGRTHQLRVHLNFIGHPIFCDNLYGGGPSHAKSFHVRYTQIVNSLFKAINRVALHANMIKICHPETMVEMEFKAPLPKDIQGALEILNGG